jgi:hypothetical protein
MGTIKVLLPSYPVNKRIKLFNENVFVVVFFSNSVVWKGYLPSVKREKTVLSKCNTDNDIFTTRKIKRYIFYCILIKKGNYCAVAYVLKNKDKSTTFTYTIRSKYKYNNRIIVIPNSVIHGKYTFQTTLFENGTILFSYKSVS